MLTEICQYLHNYFDRNRAKYHGKFEIKDGAITSFNDGELTFLNGQHFRIIGSVLNDGVHQYPAEELADEIFEGAIWEMAVPPTVVSISKQIEDWQVKYGGVDSVAMSPYNSESFGGYSYSKSGGGDGSSAGTWQAAFGGRLKPWRKLP